MYYPVTDAGQNTDSYHEFADGPFLSAKSMAWFWDCYLLDESTRTEITASPLQARIDQLAGLRKPSRSSTRTTSRATRGRRTAASSPRPACAPPASATTAPCTTS